MRRDSAECAPRQCAIKYQDDIWEVRGATKEMGVLVFRDLPAGVGLNPTTDAVDYADASICFKSLSDIGGVRSNPLLRRFPTTATDRGAMTTTMFDDYRETGEICHSLSVVRTGVPAHSGNH